jgi:hypothetical protein
MKHPHFRLSNRPSLHVRLGPAYRNIHGFLVRCGVLRNPVIGGSANGDHHETLLCLKYGLVGDEPTGSFSQHSDNYDKKRVEMQSLLLADAFEDR